LIILLNFIPEGDILDNKESFLKNNKEGSITYEKESDLIEASQIKGSRKIKIKIYDKEQNKKFNLPALPLWLIEKSLLLGLKFLRMNPDKDKRINIKDEDVKEVFEILRKTPPFVLVEVKDLQNEIEIYTI